MSTPRWPSGSVMCCNNSTLRSLTSEAEPVQAQPSGFRHRDYGFTVYRKPPKPPLDAVGLSEVARVSGGLVRWVKELVGVNRTIGRPCVSSRAVKLLRSRVWERRPEVVEVDLSLDAGRVVRVEASVYQADESFGW